MEYEIQDDNALFDRSTNPSLDHARNAPQTKKGRVDNSRDGRKGQKAEVIPEEEEQLS